jgi:hypothetical protein
MTDKITVLHAKNRTGKFFSAENPTGQAGASKLHKHKVHLLEGLKDLYELLKVETQNPHAVIIRGINESLTDQWVERNGETFNDEPRHWVMFDVDKYLPSISDPVQDPEAACKEFIKYELPAEFHDASFIWHLSSKHGKNPDELRSHLFFWLKDAKDCASIKNWAVGLSLPVDKSIFQHVQQHFIADPAFEGIDPFYDGQRLGFFNGLNDHVLINITEFAKTEGKDLVLPSNKRGSIGEFHRLFTVDEVIDSVIPEEFERIDARRLTWLKASGGSKGGAWIHDDQQHIGASHDSWPFGPNSLANLWDIVRVFKFGHLDDGCDAFERMATHAPSQQAMADWAQKEIAKRRKVIKKLDSSALIPLYESITYKMAMAVGVDVEEFIEEIECEPQTLFNFVEQCYWNTQRNKFYYLDGFEKEFFKEDFGIPFSEKSRFYSITSLNDIIDEKEASMSKTDFEKFKKSVHSVPIEHVKRYLISEKQASENKFEVDLFGQPARVVCEQGTAVCVREHVGFYQAEYDQAHIDDYKEHFPRLEMFLDFVVSARFASTRREAYLWIHATSGFGKTLLIDMLNNVGNLCLKTHMTEIEKAVSGNPSGLTIGQLVNTWAIVIDEFKSLKSEIKELTDSLRFSPKNRPMAEVPVYSKIFMSAESVDSLAGSSGVEDQFAKRFMYMRCDGEIDSRPLFIDNKPAYKASVTAYMAEYINQRIEQYRQIGKNEAARDAEKRIRMLRKELAISSSFESLADNFAEIRQDFTDYIQDAVESATNGTTSHQKREIYDLCVVDAHNHVYVKSTVKVFADWLYSTYDRAEATKIKYKTNDILGEQISIKGRSLKSKDGKTSAHKTRKVCFALPSVGDFNDPLLD